VLKILEEKLKTYKYLTGSEVSIADILIASLLSVSFRTVFDEKYR